MPSISKKATEKSPPKGITFPEILEIILLFNINEMKKYYPNINKDNIFKSEVYSRILKINLQTMIQTFQKTKKPLTQYEKSFVIACKTYINKINRLHNI